MRGCRETRQEHRPELDEAEEGGAQELEAVRGHALMLEGEVMLDQRRDEVLLQP